MHKRFMTLCLAALLLLAGCGAVSSEIKAGNWEGDSYTNAWSDINFTLDTAAFTQDTDTLKTVREAVSSKAGGGAIRTEFCLISADGNTGIMLQYSDYRPEIDNPEQAYLQEMADTLSVDASMAVGDITTTEIGGYTYYMLPFSQRGTVSQQVLARKQGQAMITWTATTGKEGDVQTAADFFATVESMK